VLIVLQCSESYMWNGGHIIIVIVVLKSLNSVAITVLHVHLHMLSLDWTTTSHNKLVVCLSIRLLFIYNKVVRDMNLRNSGIQ
jgi:hypothetical protein